jgi:hypothetical protein
MVWMRYTDTGEFRAITMTEGAARYLVRRLARNSLAISVCAIGIASIAQAQSLGPLVQVTGADPFASCAADNFSQQETAYGSVLFPETAIGPWVAADPTNFSRLLVGYQQDRWSDGGSRGNVGAVSADGGDAWTPSIPPETTACAGGGQARATDPWTAFAKDGTAFFLSMVLDPAKPTSPLGARNSAILVSRSTDHGATWASPATLLASNPPHVLNDKDSLTADPVQNGYVYAAWDQLRILPPSPQGDSLLAQSEGIKLARDLLNASAGASAVCVPASKPPCQGGAPVYKFAYTGPSILARSTDNGASWGRAAVIYSPGTNAQTIDNIVEVLPNGNVLDFFTAINVTSAGVNIGFVRSTNKALNFGLPSFATDIQVAGVVSPDSGQPLRDASILYSVAVNNVSGAIYLAWQDDRFTSTLCTTPTGSIPIDGIAFIQSLDDGQSWSAPIMINPTPPNAANPCRQQAFIPAVVASGDGEAIVVTYYDFRNDANTPAGFEGADYFAVICNTASDCSQAANWGDEQRLTTTSFNILAAPVAGGHFLGDYMGLAASGPATIVSVFGMPTGENRTAAFSREISGLP